MRTPGIPTTLLAALAAATLLATAACGSETTAGRAASTASSSPPAAGRMTEGLAQPLLLTRTGGIGGAQDRLELRPDGTCTVTRKGQAPVTRQLGEGQLASIVQALRAADLPHLATASPTERRSDQFTYVLQAEGTTFTTTETTAPDAVRPLLQQLGALLS